MHNIEPLVIWVFAVNMGMIVTMVLTELASQPHRHAIHQDTYGRTFVSQMTHRPEGVLIPINVKPLGTSRVTQEREATGPPQAA